MSWISNQPGLGHLQPPPSAPNTPPSTPVPLPPRIVVATLNAGHPTAGEWQTGQVTIDTAGNLWVCTAGGQPGSWQAGSSMSGVTSFNGRAGAVTPTAGDYNTNQITGWGGPQNLAYYKLAANAAIGAAGWFNLNTNTFTKVYDTGNNGNTGGGIYTVPATGYYWTASAAMTSTGGATITGPLITAGGTAYSLSNTGDGSCIVYATTGETIYPQFYASVALTVAATNNGAPATWFQVARLA